MSTLYASNTEPDEKNDISLAQTGNASNPSPFGDDFEPEHDDQTFSKGAEKYLREGGNIEDLPDAQDQLDMDETIRKENSNKSTPA